MNTTYLVRSLDTSLHLAIVINRHGVVAQELVVGSKRTAYNRAAALAADAEKHDARPITVHVAKGK